MHRELAENALKDAVRAHRAFTRWLAWCDGLHAAKIASGLYESDRHDTNLSASIERVYIAANKPPKMPSKTRKYQMYGDIYRAAQLAGLVVEPGSISNMEGVARVIAETTAALAAA